MNDFYDRAQALEQNQREGFIQLHKEKQNRAAVSAYFCERCEEPIPEARREAVTHKTAKPANEDSTFVRRDIDRFSWG